MHVVIDIPEEIYQYVVNTGTYGHYRFNSAKAIKNGIPLPKGHGKLKDENEIIECIRNRVENLKNDSQFIKYRKDIDLLGTIPHIRNEVRTIIEADCEET